MVTRRGVLVAALALALVAGPLLTGSGLAQSQPAPETDNTVTRIELQADGDARWTVRVRTRLSTQAAVDAYRTFQERFRNDTASYLDPFRERIQGVVASAAEATGREMRATNFTVSTDIQQVPRRWGVVSYSFTWEGFAASEENAVRVGDAFEGGLFITENDTLAIEGPPGYAVATVDPAPTRRGNATVTWVGQVDFADQRPQVRFVPADVTSGSLTPTTAGPGPEPGPGNGNGNGDGAGGEPAVGGDLVLALAGVSVGLAAVLGLLLWRRTRPEDGTGPIAETGPAAGADGGDSEPAELLSDGERVVRLLETEGGRMRQSAVADRLDWSASKTSRTVSSLAEDGEVEKLRIGRENVVSLADATDSDEPGAGRESGQGER
ncbi:MAG: helix-turn-helix domain-containing protein [Haloarculaceae archaeon]